MIKILTVKKYLQSLLKESQIFCWNLLQTEKEQIDFAKNHSLYMNYELTHNSLYMN